MRCYVAYYCSCIEHHPRNHTHFVAFLVTEKMFLALCRRSLRIVILNGRPSTSSAFRGFSSVLGDDKPKQSLIEYSIPQRVRQKVLTASDAVALVRNGDTICCAGFVSQGVPEAVLEALGKRYEETGEPHSLTIFFGGGPGDWGKRGLSNLARVSDKPNIPPMLSRTIGSHYGQVPLVEKLALENKVEAWTLPMGSVSRMIRAQATHSPGHITMVGIGTFVDPDILGGAANEVALQSPFHKSLVQKIVLDGQTYLMYKALPINVAIIRGTTADLRGNISMEQESLLVDSKIIAAAARNSGGIVIAQVKRLAATGSLPARTIAIPSPLVDAIVVVDEEDYDKYHSMSLVEKQNPAYTGEVVTPRDEIQKMPMDIRKIIARRAFFNMKPDDIVNLGIGLPEGVASVASEENLLKYVTLSTEAGAFGGLPASGHSFGPAINPEAFLEMNQMFDFYDGGGLVRRPTSLKFRCTCHTVTNRSLMDNIVFGLQDVCFLGAAQVSKTGDVNVSRMTKSRLTGPGGFIDISQSTRKVCFMTTFTAKGLEVSNTENGDLDITQEGSVTKFVDEVFEKTFSGDIAVKRGQEVWYITERAVFRRSAAHKVIELVEIAPGVDLQKDVLDKMEFKPVISKDLKIMDRRIFKTEKMNVLGEMFGTFQEKFSYNEEDHIGFLDLFGITLTTEEDVRWFYKTFRSVLAPLVEAKGPINLVVNYNGFDLRKGLEDAYYSGAKAIEKDMFKTVKRYSGDAFSRAKLGKQLEMSHWDFDSLYDLFDVNKNGKISPEELKKGMYGLFNIHLTPNEFALFFKNEYETEIDRDDFISGLNSLVLTHSQIRAAVERIGKPI